MTEELKPVRCGCGGEAVVRHIEKTSNLPKDRWYIGCPKCDICTGLYDTEAEAVQAWNKAMGVTHEKAIDYLQTTGWMQDHDRQMTERKKGEWVKEDLSGYLTPGGNSIYHCSECGHAEGPYPHPRLTDFCPNCGADLRGDR